MTKSIKTDNELNIEAAKLRGIHRMTTEEIARYCGITMKEAKKISPRWIWKGPFSETPQEICDICIEYSAFESINGYVISGDCPSYIQGMAWWQLAKELSPKVRRECVSNWQEAPRRVVEAFILAEMNKEGE